MKASKFAIDTQVISKKGNGIITKIITQSTGYVEVTLTNGKVIKEMAMNLTDMEGNSLKSKPVSKPAAAKVSDMHVRLVLSNCENAMSGRSIVAQIEAANVQPTEIVSSILSQANAKSGRISEKQAYVIASFLFANNINLK